jgi:hypothetical protein
MFLLRVAFMTLLGVALGIGWWWWSWKVRGQERWN